MSGLEVVRLPGSEQIRYIMCFQHVHTILPLKSYARPGAEYRGVITQRNVCFMGHDVPSDA